MLRRRKLKLRVQQKLMNSLSDDVLQKQLIDKWEGTTPITIGGDSITDLTGKVNK